MRAKADTYNDETRVKHSVSDWVILDPLLLMLLLLQVVVVDEVDYGKHCVALIKELEAAGHQIPPKVDQSLYKN